MFNQPTSSQRRLNYYVATGIKRSSLIYNMQVIHKLIGLGYKDFLKYWSDKYSIS